MPLSFDEWLMNFKISPKRKRRILRSTQNYLMIYLPSHPKAWKSGYVTLHVMKWEEYNNACLLKWSKVLHKDRNKKNNSKGNLEARVNDIMRLRYK